MRSSEIKSAINIFLVLLSHTMLSQNEEMTTKKEDDKSYFLVELNYISDAVFMGRKDSIAAPYLYPSMEYHNKSGFYAKGSFSYLTKSDQSRIDLFLMSAGFDFTVNKLYGDLSVTGYFFNDESYNVLSAASADLTARLIYDLEIINIGMAASTYFNDNSSSDFFMTFDVSHDFITNDNKFQFSPTASIHLGSQNFYEAYYNNPNSNTGGNTGQGGSGSGNGSGSGSGGGDGTTDGDPLPTLQIEEKEKFSLMAYEFSLPVGYNYKSATFLFLPSYVIPKSEAMILIEETLVEEELDATFYWIVGMSYKF
jgi:uncharacterized membrane protein YgcG